MGLLVDRNGECWSWNLCDNCGESRIKFGAQMVVIQFCKNPFSAHYFSPVENYRFVCTAENIGFQTRQTSGGIAVVDVLPDYDARETQISLIWVFLCGVQVSGPRFIEK
jgi:hypothetical protein